ncbi:MAG: hypothetical protein ACYCS1_09035 [Gammaproteobacteria bacterium]
MNPTRTHILIYAYRSGVLASFGHNHVIQVERERGIWLSHGEQGQGWICFPLKTMLVDSPRLRRQAGQGFRSQINTVETQATRRHMLESLDASRYPDVVLSVSNGHIPSSPWLIRIRLHGVIRTYHVPLSFVSSHQDVEAEAKLTIKQKSFQIHPYSIFAGALRVRNALRLNGRINAGPIQNQEMTYTDFISHWCP